jgi:hypothetical protein
MSGFDISIGRAARRFNQRCMRTFTLKLMIGLSFIHGAHVDIAND